MHALELCTVEALQGQCLECRRVLVDDLQVRWGQSVCGLQKSVFTHAMLLAAEPLYCFGETAAGRAT